MTCVGEANLRHTCAALSLVSSLALAWSIAENLCARESRRRYPGRLIPILGIYMLLLELSVSFGFFTDYAQLDWSADDENDDSTHADHFWKRVCIAQGVLVETALLCMASYSLWINVALNYVVGRRHEPHRVLRQLSSRSTLRTEMLIHGLILLGALLVSAVAFRKKVIGGKYTGIAACWVDQNRFHPLTEYQYFYAPMAVALSVGVGLAGWTSVRLWRVLVGSGPRQWSARTRPLRRALFGNMAWTASLVLVGAIPILDNVLKLEGFCWLANVNVSAIGLLLVFDFDVLPAYLERCFESAAHRGDVSTADAAHSAPGLEADGLGLDGLDGPGGLGSLDGLDDFDCDDWGAMPSTSSCTLSHRGSRPSPHDASPHTSSHASSHASPRPSSYASPRESSTDGFFSAVGDVDEDVLADAEDAQNWATSTENMRHQKLLGTKGDLNDPLLFGFKERKT